MRKLRTVITDVELNREHSRYEFFVRQAKTKYPDLEFCPQGDAFYLQRCLDTMIVEQDGGAIRCFQSVSLCEDSVTEYARSKGVGDNGISDLLFREFRVLALGSSCHLAINQSEDKYCFILYFDTTQQGYDDAMVVRMKFDHACCD